MGKKLRVGILGSCVTREVFTTYYNDYKQHFDLIFSHERESLISLFQNPINFLDEDIKILPDSKKNQFRSRNISNDLSKSFFDDLEKGIDYLIIDVYFEILFGILILDDNTIITNNKWDLHKTNFYKKMNINCACDVYEHPDEYFKLWTSYCDKLFAFLKESYPNVKVILNKIRLTDTVIKKNYSKYINTDFRWMVNTYSPFIKKFEDYIVDNYDVFTIEYGDSVYTSEDNRWSPYVVHFTDEYYKYVYYMICKIVGVDELHLVNSQLKYTQAKLCLHDGFMDNSCSIINEMSNEIYCLKEVIQNNETRIESNNRELDELNTFKNDVLNSSSWKLTKPLRKLNNKLNFD